MPSFDAFGPGPSAAQSCASGRSSEVVAKELNTSPRKVEQMRTISDNGDPDVIDAVKADKISVNKGYNETQKRRKEKKETSENKKAENKSVTKKEAAKKSKQQSDVRSVSLSDRHFAALKELGGLIEDHVAQAVEDYLEMMAAQNEERTLNSNEYDDDYFDDGDYDD